MCPVVPCAGVELRCLLGKELEKQRHGFALSLCSILFYLVLFYFVLFYFIECCASKMAVRATWIPRLLDRDRALSREGRIQYSAPSHRASGAPRATPNTPFCPSIHTALPLSSTMDLQETQAAVTRVLHDASSQFQRVPGSAIILRYIKSSYQDDPVRSAIELCLFLFAVRYMLSPSYSTQQKVQLSEQVRLPGIRGCRERGRAYMSIG